MSGYIKVWASMITNFIFSISVITFIISYAFSRTIDTKEINIVLTDESKTNGIIVDGALPEYVFTNLLWFSLFVFAVCLVLHFLLEPKLKVLLFPGSLCFLSVFFIQAGMFIIDTAVSTDIPAVTQEFMATFFGQINQASLMGAGMGMILLIISCFNIYYTRKNNSVS